MQKIQLNVLGISYSQSQTGAYALILADELDEKRIPIVIGAAEAQSIAITLEKMATPRPLTHDLFKSFSDAFGITILEVNIYRLEAGIFYAEIVCERKNTKVRIDARTSDAIAIALRFDCSIYTTLEVMDKAGISMNENINNDVSSEPESLSDDNRGDIGEESEVSPTVLSGYTITQLKVLMEEAVNNEDYERASKIRDEIGKREG